MNMALFSWHRLSRAYRLKGMERVTSAETYEDTIGTPPAESGESLEALGLYTPAFQRAVEDAPIISADLVSFSLTATDS